MQMWIKLLTQWFLLSTAECGSHSLEFLSTGRVQPEDQPQFEQLAVFDGVPISYCNSWTKREELKPTLESNNLPERCDEANYNIIDSVHVIPALINSTVYVIQRRCGCIRSANGIVSAFDAWAVNGMDFISFDPESQRWISQSPSAVPVRQQWNNNNDRNFAFKHFLREQCPLLIQGMKLRATHQNTELHIFAKPIADTDQALLRCHVTSTDKSVSSVHLIGDGAFKANWISVTGPIPSEDGFVILRLTAGISLSQSSNTYGCRVQTGGHNITVFWDGNTLDGKNLLNMLTVHWKILTSILGFVCIILVITGISCGTIFLLKCVKKKSRPPARVDPELNEQFTRLGQSVTSPDLQSVIFSFTRGREGEREWDRWEMSVIPGQEDIYDPEYFAHLINGAYR
ncbi:major histocompatibility complex class I-related gene protein [Dicentrarchus labrax]|uniref:major histocompatibility complex class I-related gene protein n=1 Tax=Dicentrarchus labrax TaxID=13489 RepID=UPI0021F652CC|nr:major histocompatibility complex class I-related gene protein [Dicentrarchus labrax]